MTPLHWVTCAFITINMGSVTYFELIHRPAAGNTWWSTKSVAFIFFLVQYIVSKWPRATDRVVKSEGIEKQRNKLLILVSMGFVDKNKKIEYCQPYPLSGKTELGPVYNGKIYR